MIDRSCGSRARGDEDVDLGIVDLGEQGLQRIGDPDRWISAGAERAEPRGKQRAERIANPTRPRNAAIKELIPHDEDTDDGWTDDRETVVAAGRGEADDPWGDQASLRHQRIPDGALLPLTPNVGAGWRSRA